MILQLTLSGSPASAHSSLLAQASSESPQAKMVDEGIQLYYDGRYEKASKVLEKALDSKALTKIRTIGALQYLAYCKIALGDKQGARRTFRRLLILRPEFRLPAGTAPKISNLFDQLKASMPKHEVRPASRLTISHTPPKVAIAGKSLVLRARPSSMPKGGHLLVRYRFGDSGQYSRIRMKPGSHKTFTTSIPPAMGSRADSLSYFICLIDGDDNKIANAGDKTNPFRVPVSHTKGQQDEAKDSGTSYHWWLWPVVGVVLIGTGLVVGLTLTSDDTPTGSAHVHFTLGD